MTKSARKPSGADQITAEIINFEEAAAALRLMSNDEFADEDSAPPDEPTSGFHDAEIWGEMSPELAALPIALSVAENRFEKEWKSVPEAPFKAVFEGMFAQHKIGKKEGRCFVTGTLGQSKRRTKNNVLKNYLMGIDVDSGASLEDCFQRVRAAGLTCIFYTTHSHESTGIDIAQDRFHRWAEKSQIDPTPTTETIRRYMAEETSYVASVVDSAEFVEKRQDDGMKLVVAVRPIDKFRMLFPLAAPFIYTEQDGAHKDVINLWSQKVLGLGRSFGIEPDPAARDPSRLFYLPRHSKDHHNYRVMLTCGRLIKFEDIPSAGTAKVSSDPFDQAAYIMGATARGQIVSPTLGVELRQWARDRSHGFDIAQVFKDHCEDKIRTEQSETKFTIECPFDDDHSNPGDPDDQGCFIQSAGADAETFSFHCSHAGCSGRDRLAHMQKAMRDGWFPDSILTDPTYDLAGIDDEEGQGSEVTTTRLLGLDALFKKAMEERQSDGAASAPTMEALMDCVARQKSRVPIYERVKASKIVSVTDFKKEVEARAKVFAREAERKDRLKDAEGMPGKDRHFPSFADGIRAMNEEIALVQRGSGVVFYEKRETDEPWLSIEAAPVVYRPWTYGKDFKPLFPDWVASSHRDHRTEIVFKPFVHGTKDLTPAHHLNLYRGLALEPAEGDCMDYYRHVFHIICGGNMRFFKYVMTWLAQMMQEPNKKPGTALVLRGLKGIGKGIFVDALRPILGRHSVKVSDPKQLTGNFNGHMDAKILAIAEEAFFGGDRKVDSIVKDMVSSDKMMLERKFMDATEIDDYRRFIFLSNAENVVRATPDERRYAVTLVPPEQMHNRAYWDHFVARIATGGLPAWLAYDLLHLDRDKLGVDLRTPPRTAALMDQILTNQSAEDQWLRGVLTDGTFLDADGVSLITEPKKLELWKMAPLTIPKDTIYESYRAEVGAFYGREVSPEKIGKYLLGMFKETEDGDSLVGIEGNGVTGRNYILPSLPDLRAFYEDHHLPLNHRAVDNEADFIRVTKPEVAMYPKKPETDNKFALAAHRIECDVFEAERAEMRAEADEFIRTTLGLARG
ncbi:MAG: hypothetical protein E5W19_15285 [Mesorhizobium sp.]|nr:MAG: hypothetical protein E5W19_15285 [Mesorhizobium sp.]